MFANAGKVEDSDDEIIDLYDVDVEEVKVPPAPANIKVMSRFDVVSSP